jgi:hypothetical protein
VVSGPETTLAKGELLIIIGCHARPYQSPNPGMKGNKENEGRHHQDLSQQNSSNDLMRRPSTSGRNAGGGGGRKMMESHGKKKHFRFLLYFPHFLYSVVAGVCVSSILCKFPQITIKDCLILFFLLHSPKYPTTKYYSLFEEEKEIERKVISIERGMKL